MREIKFRAWNIKEKKMWPMVQDREDFGWLAKDGREGQVELMQFTGLHDKNGKEIYEGDVVTCKFAFGDNICEIVYESACFWVSQKNRGIKDIAHDNLYWHIEGIEVIGNVWENPELLEDKATV